jgi:hypothetical protein
MILQLILFLASLTGPVPDMNSLNDKINFSGTVVEELTGEPVSGATVHVKELNKDFFTDFDGNFTIDKITPGNYSFTISFVSFKTASLNNFEISPTSSQVLVSLK